MNMIKKKKYSYFQTMQRMTECGYSAASELMQVLKNYKDADISMHMQRMHRFENDSDNHRHEIMTQLAKDVKCNIEREDIIALSNALDDVVDTVEDVSIGLYIYNVTEINPPALAYGKVILMCCDCVRSILQEFESSRNGTGVMEQIERVNQLEERGDELFAQTTREIFSKPMDAVDVIKWKSMYDRMEAACDACEKIGHLVESIVLKYS